MPSRLPAASARTTRSQGSAGRAVYHPGTPAESHLPAWDRSLPGHAAGAKRTLRSVPPGRLAEAADGEPAVPPPGEVLGCLTRTGSSRPAARKQTPPKLTETLSHEEVRVEAQSAWTSPSPRVNSRENPAHPAIRAWPWSQRSLVAHLRQPTLFRTSTRSMSSRTIS